jgi:hypothetical protein
MEKETITIPVKRWYAYVFVVALFIMIAFYSGYRLGKTVEKKEWLEMLTPAVFRRNQPVAAVFP